MVSIPAGPDAAEPMLPGEAKVAAVKAFFAHAEGYDDELWHALMAGLRAAAPLIAAAERERIYALLGNDHFVIFTEDRWTIEHSVDCRLSGRMHECGYHAAVARITAEFDPEMLGRWRIDGEDLPSLVRADPAAEAVPGA
jgi:hypothetical protein